MQTAQWPSEMRVASAWPSFFGPACFTRWTSLTSASTGKTGENPCLASFQTDQDLPKPAESIHTLSHGQGRPKAETVHRNSVGTIRLGRLSSWKFDDLVNSN